MTKWNNINAVIKKVRERSKILHKKREKYVELDDRVRRLADMLSDAFYTKPMHIDNVSDEIKELIYKTLDDTKDLEDFEIDEYCRRQYGQNSWLLNRLFDANKEKTK